MYDYANIRTIRLDQIGQRIRIAGSEGLAQAGVFTEGTVVAVDEEKQTFRVVIDTAILGNDQNGPFRVDYDRSEYPRQNLALADVLAWGI